MSEAHEFRCNSCGHVKKAYYNGEHYLPPKGWVEFYDANEGKNIGVHLCDGCRAVVIDMNVCATPRGRQVLKALKIERTTP